MAALSCAARSHAAPFTLPQNPLGKQGVCPALPLSLGPSCGIPHRDGDSKVSTAGDCTGTGKDVLKPPPPGKQGAGRGDAVYWMQDGCPSQTQAAPPACKKDPVASLGLWHQDVPSNGGLLLPPCEASPAPGFVQHHSPAPKGSHTSSPPSHTPRCRDAVTKG